MELTIGQNLSNNKVKLEYTQKGKITPYMPTYKINTEKADEFVKKYNSQTSNLNKLTAGLIIIGSFLGYKSAPTENKIVKFILGAPIGFVIGSISGTLLSLEHKNKLMSKYNVEKY